MQEILTTIKEWITNTSTDVLSLFTQYYQYIMMFTSSLAADLIMNSGKAAKKNKDKFREEDSSISKDVWKYWMMRTLKLSGIYLALLILSTAVYAGRDTYTLKAFGGYFLTVFASNFTEQWMALVFIRLLFSYCQKQSGIEWRSWLKDLFCLPLLP